MGKSRILLVEDSPQILELANRLMALHCEVLLATSLEVGLWTFNNNMKRIRIVLLDASLDARQNCDTLPLAMAIKAAKDKGDFHGEAIAITTNLDHRQTLVDTGCLDPLHFLGKNNSSTIKLDVFKKIVELAKGQCLQQH